MCAMMLIYDDHQRYPRPSDPPRLQRIGCAVSAAELMDAVKDNRLLRSVVVMLGTGR